MAGMVTQKAQSPAAQSLSSEQPVHNWPLLSPGEVRTALLRTIDMSRIMVLTPSVIILTCLPLDSLPVVQSAGDGLGVSAWWERLATGIPSSGGGSSL